MKQYNIVVILLLLTLMGCKKEKTVERGYEDVDWFAIQDNPDDPLDHLRYDVYKTNGISIFITDTLGVQFRGFNGYGDSIMYVEKLRPGYAITIDNSSYYRYTLSADRNALYQGTMFLKDHVIPMLIPEAYPRSFLLVNSLTLSADNANIYSRWDGVVYRGSSATIVSRVASIGGMSENAKMKLAAQVVAPLWYSLLSRQYGNSLLPFYAVSDNSVTYPATSTSKTVYNARIRTGYVTFEVRDHWNKYGFLTYNWNLSNEAIGGPNAYTQFYSPTQEQDVTSFIEAALSMSETEFQTMYQNKAGYIYLIAKYRLIKTLLEAAKK